MSFLPIAGALVQGVQQKQAQDFNAQVMTQQRDTSINQANAAEGQVRRQSREAFGRQVAAFGAAGVGYGGSTETALDQSLLNQEADALSTRYKGAITGHGYDVQAGIDRSQGSTDMTRGSLMAGAALLKGIGSNYAAADSSDSLGW